MKATSRYLLIAALMISVVSASAGKIKSFDDAIVSYAGATPTTLGLIVDSESSVIFLDKAIESAYADETPLTLTEGAIGKKTYSTVEGLDSYVGQTLTLAEKAKGMKEPATYSAPVIDGNPTLTLTERDDEFCLPGEYEASITMSKPRDFARDIEVYITNNNTGESVNSYGWLNCFEPGSYQSFTGTKMYGDEWMAEDTILFTVPEPSAYIISLQINVVDNGQGFVQYTNPGEQVIKSVWNVSNLESFIGTHVYDRCNAFPGGAINTIQEINTNYNGLTEAQKQEFSGNAVEFQPFVNDLDGDGLTCNPEDPDGKWVTRYELNITPQ